MAMLWISILWSLLTMQRVDSVAGYLLIPYLLRVSYAFTLNAGFWVLNRTPRGD